MIIKGPDIFLTWAQSEQILTDKVEREISEISFKMPQEFDKFLRRKNQIVYDELKRQMLKPEKAIEFKESWLKFDIVGTEARQNTFNLLQGFNTRENLIKLKGNRIAYTGNDYEFDKFYPLGQVFSMVYEIPEIKNWYGKKIQKSTEVDIMIDTRKVTRISGEFKFLFTIYFQHQKIIFGNGISIITYEK